MKTNLLPKHVTIKIISFIIGYSLWIIASSSTTVDFWLEIPVCFYNIPENSTLHTLETVRVHITGPRHALQHAIQDIKAAHIDAEQLRTGKNFVILSPANIFLPNAIKYVEQSPSILEIEVSKSEHA